MSLTLQNARQLQGATMHGPDGAKIGKVSEVYLDQDTDTPEWALVHTGLFGGKGSCVPLAQASLAGDSLTVPYTKAQIKDAPTAEPDGELSQSEEAALYAHYGLPYSENASDSGLPTTGGTTTAATQPMPAAPVGRDTARTDDAMTRSEERLRVGTERVTTGRVKLRKYVVTEQVHQTVPVTSERAVVTHEAVTDANRGQAIAADPPFSEREVEVALTSERPVVAKETVPVERIRADKAVVTENVTVNETLRKEQIELEDDTHGGTPGTDRTRR